MENVFIIFINKMYFCFSNFVWFTTYLIRFSGFICLVLIKSEREFKRKIYKSIKKIYKNIHNYKILYTKYYVKKKVL